MKMVNITNKDFLNIKGFPFKAKNSPSFKKEKISLYSDNPNNNSNRTMFKSFLEFKNRKDKTINNIHSLNQFDGKVNMSNQPGKLNISAKVKEKISNSLLNSSLSLKKKIPQETNYDEIMNNLLGYLKSHLDDKLFKKIQEKANLRINNTENFQIDNSFSSIDEILKPLWDKSQLNSKIFSQKGNSKNGNSNHIRPKYSNSNINDVPLNKNNVLDKKSREKSFQKNQKSYPKPKIKYQELINHENTNQKNNFVVNLKERKFVQLKSTAKINSKLKFNSKSVSKEKKRNDSSFKKIINNQKENIHKVLNYHIKNHTVTKNESKIEDQINLPEKKNIEGKFFNNKQYLKEIKSNIDVNLRNLFNFSYENFLNKDQIDSDSNRESLTETTNNIDYQALNCFDKRNDYEISFEK